MIKAIFLDYTGTITQEGGPDVAQMLKRCAANSNCKDMQTLLQGWWTLLREFEEQSYGENFVTEDEIVDKILARWKDEIQLDDDFEELHTLCQRFWMYAPIFDDVKDFFERCPVPIYLLTNNGAQYVEVAMRENDLHPTAIICGDMVRAYKPHRELFDKALEISGLSADSVIHVGDSVTSDVKGALSAGIRPVLLNRSEKPVPAGITSVTSLSQILDMIQE